ncbi:MAG: DUF805 domain-containing protein [Croceibacterium sp.]
MEWMLMPLRRYAEFSGRSQRMEYWMYTLFIVVLSIVTNIVETVLGINGMVAGLYGPLTVLLLLATLIPSIAVGIRRLHDTDRSGWWLLIVLVPIIGAIVLLVFYVMDGTEGSNRFGPDPKEPPHSATFA